VARSRQSAVTIGAYDGVHLGHRRVIETVRSLALAEGLRSVVVTFDRHPASVVRPQSAPKLLTDLGQKLELLKSIGVDDVEVVHFDEERSGETAEEFVDEVLVGELAAKVIVVGSDFHFGKARGGNVALLEEMGRSRGFRVIPFDLVSDDLSHEVVSSTRIRDLVSSGRLDEAASLLGRPYEVRGVLASSDSGSTPGVRVPDEVLLPPPGGFLTRVGPVRDEESGLTATLAKVDGPACIELSDPAPSLSAGEDVRVLFDAAIEGS
jgi:riboflavin kinase/FMN adenylyltransferase